MNWILQFVKMDKSQQYNNEFKKSKLQNAKVGILSLIKLKNLQINTVCVYVCAVCVEWESDETGKCGEITPEESA